MQDRLRTVTVRLLVALVTIASPLLAGDDVAYRVTIQNLTASQPLSQPVAATHAKKIGMFRVGGGASPGLEAIAEDGNEMPLFHRLDGRQGVTEVVHLGAPLTPSGEVVGDFHDAATFVLRGRQTDRLSLATMLICTNDGFTGLDRAQLPRQGSGIYLLDGYDAGTEDNTELSMDIVDPCSGLGPVPLNGDPNGNIDDAVDTFPREAIRHHDGIVGGIGDLLPAHDWQNPVAKVTVTRVSKDSRRFSAGLEGAGENPMVDTLARGRIRVSLGGGKGNFDDDEGDDLRDDEGDDETAEAPPSSAVKFHLFVRNIQDVAQAHIHKGLPSQNGPVVAFLFGPSKPTGPFNGLLSLGTIDESDLVGPLAGNFPGFLEALRAGELYVNVHTVQNPAGEIRGQIGAD